MEPLAEMQASYQRVMASVPHMYMLHDVSQDLQGLQQCITFGPNEEKTPLPDVEDYYAWASWKSFTLELFHEKHWAAQQFRSAAMRRYVTLAHRYLQSLGYVSSDVDL